MMLRIQRILCSAFMALAVSVLHAQTPKQGGTLNLIVQPEPPSINLGLSKLGPSSFVGSKIYEGRIVEIGKVAAITGAPEHPYTRSLFEAMPGQAWEKRSELIAA